MIDYIIYWITVVLLKIERFLNFMKRYKIYRFYLLYFVIILILTFLIVKSLILYKYNHNLSFLEFVRIIREEKFINIIQIKEIFRDLFGKVLNYHCNIIEIFSIVLLIFFILNEK